MRGCAGCGGWRCTIATPRTLRDSHRTLRTRSHSPVMFRVTDAHIHIQPFHMMKPDVQRTFWHRKDNRAELEASPRIRRSCCGRWTPIGIERVGLINYVSPDVMGFTAEVERVDGALRGGRPVAAASRSARSIRAFVDRRRRRDRPGDRTGRARAQDPSAAPVVPRQRLPGRAAGAGRALPRAEAAGIPVTIHTGTSVFPGARSRFGDPMDVDDVAIDFPKLTILLAHGGRPLWMEAAFFVVRRHPNVFLEVSGIPPAKLLEYFPAPRGDRGQDRLGDRLAEPGGEVDAAERRPVSRPAAQRRGEEARSSTTTPACRI